MELNNLLDPLEDDSIDYDSPPEIIELCGSFVNIREDIVSFVYQSAKDFLLDKAAQ
jgi:hypothetical protein